MCDGWGPEWWTNGSVPDIPFQDLVGFGIHANVSGEVDHAVAFHGRRERHHWEGRWVRICLDDFLLTRHCKELVSDLSDSLRGYGHGAMKRCWSAEC